MSDNSTDAVPKHHYYDEKFLMMNRRADGVDERFDKLEDKMEEAAAGEGCASKYLGPEGGVDTQIFFGVEHVAVCWVMLDNR